MKFYKIALIVLIISTISCTAKKNEVIIAGKIIGEIPKKVEFTKPINGTWFYGSKQSVKPDSLGNFQIKVDIDSPSFITLYIPKKANGTLLVEPRKNYNINFNLNLTDKKFSVTGQNSKGQNLYNSFPNPEFNIFGLREHLKDSVTTVIASKIKAKQQNEISLFKKLFDKGEISEGFFNLVKLDRACYYAALKGNIALYKYRESYGNKKEDLKNNSLHLWNETFEAMPTTTPMLFRSPWFYALAQNYINYNEYRNPSFTIEKLTEIYKQGKIHTHTINESKKYLTKNRLEYFNASYLYYQFWQTKDNSKELIALYNSFKLDYPNSKYTKYLEPMIAPIIKFHKKAEEASVNNKINFINDYKNINSFDELTKILRGKKTYIDIWGTWCGPCKEEFQYKNELNKLLKSKDVNLLYICEGNISKEKIWKEMIQGYGLEGYHIRTNKTLLADIIKKFGNNGSFYYPRYLLIDENGNVLNAYAAKPSELNALKKQL